MLTQSDIERERYEVRRKAQLDHESWLSAVRREGEQIGKLIGAIHAYEQMLQRPETLEEQLRAQSLEDLSRLATGLKQRVLNQR